ncbi:NUDIX domain-containing protein [Methanobrevibacter sp.]|uniref:NUDIX domain-containing protein n=1 Tax=Methanobrevibacter sp. TaxID=66852 RepID=UPI0025E95F98|nr:NUDIX domain-containing protein [Methanobrevibacter sp.]MBQ2666351.1 NUDIX domain-containing protein [Methanobrevibacter sp.]MBQ2666956.1 NUDIX domain-containing protein [Methanobrevibacter sp.]
MATMWGLAVRGICEFNGKYLLLKIRSKSAHDAGRWEIPGGKVKKCEYFDNALKREYLEETGLEVDVDSLMNVVRKDYTACKTNEEVKSIQLIMKVTCQSDEVTISEEHDDYGWFSWDEVEDMISKGMLTPPAVEAFSKK